MDGVISVLLVMSLETYVPAVVAGEMYSDWPIEALKAQAVLARTYGLYHIKHPKGPGYDLWGDSRSQHYAPEMIKENDLLASGETFGIYVSEYENGLPGFFEYVSKCGRKCCPYCEGKPGFKTKDNPEGLWADRACQWGMKVMADSGLNYEEIIKYYYGDVYLVKGEYGEGE